MPCATHGDGSSRTPTATSAETAHAAISTSIIELIRVFGEPRTMAAGLATNDWRVVDDGPVPTTDAVAGVAWHIESTSGAVAFGPVTVTDYELRLRSDCLGVYAVGTGTAGDISVTTSNTFLQWGEPVEIPDPTQP